MSTDFSAPSDYLTTEEVASLLRTTPATVHYWRHKEIGPKGFRVGRRILYRRIDVEAWVESAAAEHAGS